MEPIRSSVRWRRILGGIQDSFPGYRNRVHLAETDPIGSRPLLIPVEKLLKVFLFDEDVKCFMAGVKRPAALYDGRSELLKLPRTPRCIRELMVAILRDDRLRSAKLPSRLPLLGIAFVKNSISEVPDRRILY